MNNSSSSGGPSSGPADPVASPAAGAGSVAAAADLVPLEERLDAMLSSSSAPFSVAAYLNAALGEHQQQGGTNKQQHGAAADEMTRVMTELALQLQLQTQACHEDIGRISAELNALLPRCYADITRIGKGLEGLQMDIGGEGSGSGSLYSLVQTTGPSSSSDRGEQHQQHSSSLETLGTLHALQVNLRRTHEILTAAATWDATLQSVSVHLSQSNVVPAVKLWRQLEHGAGALRGMPDEGGVEERDATLSRIRSQILHLLQPQLQHALQNMTTRIAPLQQCVALYRQLGTASMEKLVQEYVKIRPAPIHKAWFDYKPPVPTAASMEGDQGSAPAKPNPFLDWLPGWFEAVLSLLGEERRQSQSIFGPTMVPEITTKVLSECFRPILPSFRSRLESMCPSNPQAAGSAVVGGAGQQRQHALENLCGAYEQTLQFLALTYESVAGAWLDMVDASLVPPGGVAAGAGGGGGGIAVNDLLIYRKMTAIFLQVTQPFRTYQEQLPQLEAKYSGRVMEQVGAEMQRIVNASTSAAGAVAAGGGFGGDYGDGEEGGDRLQQAVEQLKSHAGTVFSVAQGAVARFELLSGGYGATPALKTVDEIVASHASRLSNAVPALQQHLGDGSSATSSFDESHVFSALQVLHIAGSFQMEVKSLEEKTRERLGVLGDRVASFLTREEELKQAEGGRGIGSSVATTHATTSTAFVLPEGLSTVEIDSIVTRSVCGSLLGGDEEVAASTAALQRLAAAPDVGAAAALCLFPNSDRAMKQLAHSCHLFVFDVCSAVPRHHLKGMSSLSTWKEQATADAFASYGTLPQPYITHVGEHMLALVQALEPFASDASALAVANQVMDGVRDVALAPWRDLVTAATLTSDIDDGVVRSLMDGKQLADLVVSSAVMEDEEGEELEEDADEQERAITAFCNSWLDVVGLAVTGRLLERIMRIPSLTQKGCEHLNADLTYLVNVFSALGVSGHPHPLLGHVAELAVLDGDALSDRIASRNLTHPLDAALAAMEERLAAIRGVAARYNY